MVQLYIKYKDDNYYLLDLDPNEGINYKLTVKDLSDITKIYSPYTQSFTLQATDKNKMLCGFVGNEKIQRINSTGEFDSMIYISGFLFQSGKLSFEESDYQFNDQKNFKTSFASNLTSLSDKLGDLTVQQLFQDDYGSFDPLVKTQWNKNVLKDRMQSIKNLTLSNGINFKWGVPFISNNRVWTYDDDNLDIIDNIAYRATKPVDNVNFISLTEVRPAVTYMTIMEHLLLKIGTPVICPLFESTEVKDLYVWGNSANLIADKETAYPITSYTSLSYLRYDTKQEITGYPLPPTNSPKWLVTEEASGVFKIDRNESVFYPTTWGDGFDVNLVFNGLVALGESTKIKVVLRNTTNNVIIDSQEITGNTYTYRILDSLLNSSGFLYFRFEILPVSLVDWTSITFKTIQKFRIAKKVLFGTRVTKGTYEANATNNSLSTSLGGNELNLISILPKMKCVDFLKSFFKTFNISVISTGLNDQSMYWITSDNIKETNKPYSKRIVDYTSFVDIASLNKKKANQYNQYIFKHFDSKYYESEYGYGTKFGSLTYPTTAPDKPTKFEVTTNYSIIKTASTFKHPSNLKTCLAFEKDSPEVLESGAVRYTPVYDEFTIFYLKPRNLELSPLSLEYSPTGNNALYAALEATYKNPISGKLLSFGAESEVDTDSLYLNYYDDFITLLLDSNSYLSTFNVVLPPNEIFLNFANLKQGESNIPTGFRAQNEIIIGEQRYILQDASFDLTTGKGKISVINL